MTPPPETIKTPLEGSETQTQGVGSQEVFEALRKAYYLGQTYWQQADSEYVSDWKKSDKTAQQFKDFQREFSSKFN